MAEPSLMLHPKKGVNPRLSVCRNCGKEVGVVLLGVHDRVYTCPCGCVHVGRPDRGECQKCGRSLNDEWKTRVLAEGERLPMGLCDECETREEEIARVVREGGIHCRCRVCGARGAIRGDHPLARAVRAQAKIAPPRPVGVEFEGPDGRIPCPECLRLQEGLTTA